MPSSDEIRLDFNQGIRADSGTWYNCLQKLGQGGNATTFLMMAGGGSFEGIPFAVKVFRRVSRSERRDSFLKEVRFLRGCHHPGVLRVFDEGTFRDSHPFVVAEYLPSTLADVIRSGSAGLVEKLSFALQLLSSLAYLASLQPQVIHRDIKPDNIFVKGRSCVLGDFGLMKRVNGLAEVEPKVVIKESVGPGMPFFYRTPDLINYALGKAEPTVASDVFQLGLVLAELFTGRNPQKRAEHDDHLSEIEMERLSMVPGTEFGPMISNLISSMLHLKPTERVDVQTSLTAWRGLFVRAAREKQAHEGRVF